MADYLVEHGDNGIEPYITTANQVDTITFEENVDRVSVISNGGAEVRVTNGGTTPTFGAPGSSTICFRLPAGAVGVRDIPLPKYFDVLKVLSSGAAEVSIEVQR